MYKFVIAAAVASSASALALNGANGLTSLLLLDQLTNDNYYYGHGSSDLLPLLALGGNLGASANLNEYLLWDRVSERSHRYESLPLLALTGNAAAAQEIFMLDRFSHGGNKFLPMAVMSGQVAGFTDPMTKMWAMNRYGGGSSRDFNNLVTMDTIGLPTGTSLNQVWGMQQMQKGHDSLFPLMAATGQALPTTMDQLWMLDSVSPAHHSYGYGRRGHGYTRHAPVRAAAPQRIQRFAQPAPVAQPVAQQVVVEEETTEEP